MPTDAQGRQKITGEIQIPSQLVEEHKGKITNLSHLRSTLQKAESEGVTSVLDVLLISILSLDASDIHIEPEEKSAKIRLRIDGMLQDLMSFPRDLYETILSRVKLVSGIKLNVTSKPQDGRFSFTLSNEEPVESRVATLPSEYGESVVLRILNPKNLMTLENLGLRQDLLTLLKRELKKPNGMILATGPTGSGKTTTLYACLKEINKPEIKIVTIEDPIEYHLGGVSQTQVHPEKGYDFPSGLQAIVRQDPDVILVGEIRDSETAQIALQAALTGHLVFSTLHTNDAAGTITRFISLGAKPINIAAACNFVIGQRLARKVCGKCATFTKITDAEFEKIKRGVGGIKGISVPKILPTMELARIKGCAECNNTGYRGRIGIFEAIAVDHEMEEYILATPSIGALEKFAIKKGMITMYQDGLLKVVERITTFEEIERVTGEDI